jgi:phosphate transport system permease protein
MSSDALTPQAGLSRSPAGVRGRSQSSLLARGEPMLWLTGGALAVALAMIVALVLLILLKGTSTFWPSPIVELHTFGGTKYLGEITDVESYRPNKDVYDGLSAKAADKVRQFIEESGGVVRRRLIRTENYELTGSHFHWVNDFLILEETQPAWALLLERQEGGRFYGFPKQFRVDGKLVAKTPADVWMRFNQFHAENRARWRQQQRLESHEIGQINSTLERARLDVRAAELDYGEASPQVAGARQRYEEIEAQSALEAAKIQKAIHDLREVSDRYRIVMQTADGQQASLRVAEIVRAYPANQLSTSQRLSVYLSRWWEFLTSEPREANSEGGVFPAIFGTVVMTLLMSLAVVPFGVLAALYLREYARGGVAISAVRVAINNLAGVPSIVFGVFGLGFFCYLIGGAIDNSFYEASLPNPTFGKGALVWASFTLALMTLPVVIVATEEALSAVPNSMREGSFACGASKWQTIRRIVLPRALPGIMTGMILAMARGAGEVAPLMLVGAVKLAPELPLDWLPPFGTNRSFMHLGFHIFDLGFQSQNSEAAKPMVFTTTLLLILIIATLNIAAVWLRGRLRRRFVTAQF